MPTLRGGQFSFYVTMFLQKKTNNGQSFVSEPDRFNNTVVLRKPLDAVALEKRVKGLVTTASTSEEEFKALPNYGEQTKQDIPLTKDLIKQIAMDIVNAPLENPYNDSEAKECPSWCGLKEGHEGNHAVVFSRDIGSYTKT